MGSPFTAGAGVLGPASATDGSPVLMDGTTGRKVKETTYAAFATSLGAVIGPSSATDGEPVLFDGTTGKLVKAGSASGIGTRSTSTGATTISFTSVVAPWATEITLSFTGLSLSGTDSVRAQLGTGGTYATSGYIADGGVFTAGPATGMQLGITNGIPLRFNGAADVMNGKITASLVGANQWQLTATYAVAGTVVGAASGFVTLGGAADSVRLITTGSDTFDANAGVNVQWR